MLVIEGMYQHFTGLLNNKTKGMDQDGIILVTKNLRNIYDLLYECLTDKDFKSPIDYRELMNPHSEFT